MHIYPYVLQLSQIYSSLSSFIILLPLQTLNFYLHHSVIGSAFVFVSIPSFFLSLVSSVSLLINPFNFFFLFISSCLFTVCLSPTECRLSCLFPFLFRLSLYIFFFCDYFSSPIPCLFSFLITFTFAFVNPTLFLISPPQGKNLTNF